MDNIDKSINTIDNLVNNRNIKDLSAFDKLLLNEYNPNSANKV